MGSGITVLPLGKITSLEQLSAKLDEWTVLRAVSGQLEGRDPRIMPRPYDKDYRAEKVRILDLVAYRGPETLRSFNGKFVVACLLCGTAIVTASKKDRFCQH